LRGKYESMRAKMKKNFYGGELQKLNSNGLKRQFDISLYYSDSPPSGRRGNNADEVISNLRYCITP
ncbi:hypothetical protein, partial [Bacteroides caecimuris]|uniref:hypothetical protein n=1 Tax=Bacteroides caecimuris TaxID=1796613 RepID=UPI00242A925A